MRDTSSLRRDHSRNRASRHLLIALVPPCCTPIRRATGLHLICLAALCSWLVAARPVARLRMSWCALGAASFLSVSRHRRVPRRFRGKDVYWWLEKMGRFAQTIDSFPLRQWPPSIVVTGVNGGYDVNVREMAANGVRVLGRVLDVAEARLITAPNANTILDEADAAFGGFLTAARELTAANPELELDADEAEGSPPLPATLAEIESLDLRRERIGTVIWATGYEYAYSWLRAPVLDAHGRPVQHRGVSPARGLDFVGLHWMHTIKSGLLSGVGSDAEYIADQIDLTT
jgi:putative flavoprotein involved in K+ transport